MPNPIPPEQRGYVCVYSRTCFFTDEVEVQHGRIWRTRELAEQAAVGSGWTYEIVECRTIWPDAATLQQARAA